MGMKKEKKIDSKDMYIYIYIQPRQQKYERTFFGIAGYKEDRNVKEHHPCCCVPARM